MNKPVDEDITQLLHCVRDGDKEAESRLINLVYGELHAIASRHIRRERSGHTLQTTALVHEAYLRLSGQRDTDWRNRAHFFGVAAQVMRHILVDYARGRLSGKRGAGAANLALDPSMVIATDRLEHLLVLEDALQRLEVHDPRAIRVFVMRFFGGLTMDEIAELLKISPRTAKRDWNYGRAWLRNELGPGNGDGVRESGQN